VPRVVVDPGRSSRRIAPAVLTESYSDPPLPVLTPREFLERLERP
jgi:hypothetical protein